MPVLCSPASTINLVGPNTSSRPANPTCLQVMTPTTTLYARRRDQTKTNIPSNQTTSALGTLISDVHFTLHTVVPLHHLLDTNPRTHRTPRRATSRIHTDPLQPKPPALITYSESSARSGNYTASTSNPIPLPRVDETTQIQSQSSQTSPYLDHFRGTNSGYPIQQRLQPLAESSKAQSKATAAPHKSHITFLSTCQSSQVQMSTNETLWEH